jgi:hypothetical protein
MSPPSPSAAALARASATAFFFSSSISSSCFFRSLSSKSVMRNWRNTAPSTPLTDALIFHSRMSLATLLFLASASQIKHPKTVRKKCYSIGSNTYLEIPESSLQQGSPTHTWKSPKAVSNKGLQHIVGTPRKQSPTRVSNSSLQQKVGTFILLCFILCSKQT